MAFGALFLVCLAMPVGVGRAGSPPATGQAIIVETPDQLWSEAAALAENPADRIKAARLYLRLYEKFPDSPRAAGALLKGASLYREEALAAREPDWEQVRDLYRQFIAAFPDSPQVPAAYFEVGRAYYRMHFFREALSYFKLFQRWFPTSSLIPRARYWQAKTLYGIGRLDEAARLFEQVAAGAETGLRLKALVGLGDIKSVKKDYWGARIAYGNIMKHYPSYYFGDLDLLIKLGKAYTRTGDEELGRKTLFHYLNLAEQQTRRAEVLFELGESFHRAGDAAIAQRLYGEAVNQGSPEERAVILARFRQAEYRDFPGDDAAKLKKKSDLTDRKGDAPYLAVLGTFHAEPIAQDARYDLMRRYLARQDYEQAFVTGKNYLRRSGGRDPRRREVADSLGDILVRRFKDLLQKKDYPAVYHLYRDEYKTVAAYDKGRLLVLVGRALEAMGLYDQAAVVYYRALGLTLTAGEKADLYFHRAEVYLANRDWASASRLLAYLRKIYQGRPEAGEIYYLSGRLAEKQGDFSRALDFYDRIVPPVTYPDRKPVYAEARLRMLFALDRYEDFLAALDRYKKESWLSGAKLQEWYVRLGDGLRRHDDRKAAVKAYLAGVDENMPHEGERTQRIYLYLGDLFRIAGEAKKSRSFFRKAEGGPDPLWTKIARQRLNQADIKALLVRMKTVLN